MAQGLALRQVSKRYSGSVPVLQGVDLDVRPGEVVAVTGGNGSGKSTLLKIIAGLLLPSDGMMSGRPRRIGYVPERFPSQQRMPARSYLIHMGRIRGLGTGTAQARAEELMRRLELAGGLDTPLRQLSKGNAQKVAIAQALMPPPDLLVLDEPWSGLDASAHEVLRELIGELATGGGAVVFTDHREAVVEAETSIVYHLERGRLAEAAPGRAGPAISLARTRPAHAGSAHVVLTCAQPAIADLRWERIPGVRRVDRLGPGGVSIQVADEGCDRLLFTAIRAGWSVRQVVRHSAVHTAEARR